MTVPQIMVIPTELCMHALKTRFVRQTQVFVYLKFRCSGKIRLVANDLENIRIDLGLKSIRTVKDCLKNLQAENWIGYSKRSRYYFIKGFDNIRQMNKFIRRGGAEFCFDDIKLFKGFLIAVVIGSLINTQKRCLRAVERLQGGSKTSVRKHSSKYFPIANKALSDILNVSISTAYEWKRASKKQGFIRIKKNREILEEINPKHLVDFKKYGNKPSHLIRCSKGKVFLQLPDLVYSKINFKRRKKLIHSEIN